MIRYLLVRIALGLVAVIGVTIVTFVGERTAGSPVYLMVAPTASRADIDRVRHDLGLDRPLPVQYAIFLEHAVRGDFGTSIKFAVPARQLVTERVGATVELAGTAFLFAIVVGVGLGVLAAAFRGTVIDRLASVLGLVGQAMPGFWVGIMLILLFAVKLRWLPVAGRGGLSHLVLPALTLSWFSTAAFLRLTRSAMLDVLESDYVKLARLKGVPEWRVVGGHALRNTAVTVVTYAGLTHRDAARRRRDRGDDLRLARHRQPAHVGAVRARLPGDPGRRGARLLRLRRLQPARRPALRRARPADPRSEDGVSAAAQSPDLAAAGEHRGLRDGVLRRVPVLPILLLLPLVVFGVFGALVAPYDISTFDLGTTLQPPVFMHGGSWSHVLGTDPLGRDTLSLLIVGARASLVISLVGVALAGAVGVAAGVVAGLAGGVVDELVMRLVDMQLAVPPILLAVLLSAALGGGLRTLIVTIAVAFWPTYARIVRGETLALKQRDFVQLAVVAGCGKLRIARRHLLPNLLGSIVVVATLQLGAAVGVESALSFLGLGVQAPSTSWGLMISDGKGYLDTRVVGRDLPGRRDCADRPRRQSPRRLAARRARPDDEARMKPEPVLSVRALTTRISVRGGSFAAVDGVDFELAPGEALGLVGESGSGKSMTCLSLVRLLPRAAAIVSGSIELDGEELTDKRQAEMRRIRGRDLAMILQDPLESLNPVFTIGTQVGEAVRLAGTRSRERVRERVIELLRRVRIAAPEERLRAFPFQFSGGMRQRVTAAIAIARGPKVLIADEPTTALDVTTQRQFLDLLDGLRREDGMALLLVTHDLGLVGETCDRVAIMYAGRIVEHGPVDRVFEAPAHPYTRALLEAVPEVDARPPAPADPDRGRAARHARAPARLPLRAALPARGRALPRRVPAGARGRRRRQRRVLARGREHGGCMTEPLLELRDVVRVFDVRSGTRGLRRRTVPLRAVDGVTLEIPAGSSTGIAGESGSGKSTLVRLVLLLDRPTAGTVRFEGRDLASLDREGLAWYRRRVQAVFQDATASLNPRMRVRDLVAEPLEAQRLATRREADKRVRELLAEVGLPERAYRAFPHQLSGGQRQRVAIARALVIEPALIVLDEPVSALDVSIRSQVLNLLLELQERKGLTYLLVAHDLALLRHVTDRLAVMYLGRVVEEGETERLLHAPAHPYTRALLDSAPQRSRRGREPLLEGEIAPELALAEGCPFRPRCPLAVARCAVETPALTGVGEGQRAACHVAAPTAAVGAAS